MNGFSGALIRPTIKAAATFVQPPLQLVQDSKALVQLLFDHLPHVVVHFTGLHQLLEGLAELLQLLTMQGSKSAALLNLLPQS